MNSSADLLLQLLQSFSRFMIPVITQFPEILVLTIGAVMALRQETSSPRIRSLVLAAVGVALVALLVPGILTETLVNRINSGRAPFDASRYAILFGFIRFLGSAMNALAMGLLLLAALERGARPESTADWKR